MRTNAPSSPRGESGQNAQPAAMAEPGTNKNEYRANGAKIYFLNKENKENRSFLSDFYFLFCLSGKKKILFKNGQNIDVNVKYCCGLAKSLSFYWFVKIFAKSIALLVL